MESLKPALTHPFLSSLSPAYLAVLAECAEHRQFAAEEIIFREGEVADRFYLIQEGKVALESHVPPKGRLIVQDLGRDDVLGWSWLFPPYVWHFQARAVERTRAITFNGAHLLVACERNHEFGYDLMKRLAQVLIRRLQATQQHLVKLHQQTTRPAS
jgi:CRP-like cAMP-binding protein